MRSLSSTVSEMPSSWAPSRSVVSYTSTSSGALDIYVFQPVFVLVDFAADGGEVGLLDLPGDRSRSPGTDLAVVDRANGHDLGGGPGDERFLARIQIAAQDVADVVLEA